MDKKQKLRVVVIFPVIAVVLVLGGVIYSILQVASTPTAALEQEQEQNVSGTPVMENGEEGMAPADDMQAGADEAVTPAPETAAPSCAFDFLIGQTFEQAEEQVKPLDRPYRIIKPGDAVTQDYSPDRINLNVDETGMVTSVTCG